MSDLREALRESARLLQRYVTETPPRHQPHMIAHEAEASIRASSAALAEPAQPMQFEPNIYGHGEPPRDPAHTDHGRHWDRTCPACNASIDYGSAEPAQEMTDEQISDCQVPGLAAGMPESILAFARNVIAADRASRLPEITDERIAALGREFGHATACEGYEHGTLWFDGNLIPFARAVEALVRGKT